jgi:hypothetical protein
MLGLPSIAMVIFATAALVARHWRHKIERAARHDRASRHSVHLALDPESWGGHGEAAHSNTVPQAWFQNRTHDKRRRGLVAAHLLRPDEQAEADFVSINCEPENSNVRAAQRRKAFKVVSNL